MNNDIWTTHISINTWMSSKVWDSYFCEIEYILGDKIIKLDSKDPVCRKADIQSGEGDFVVDFGKNEDSRWIFGKFDKTKIEFQIHHFNSGLDSFGRPCCNRIKFYIPHLMSSVPDIEKITKLFTFTNIRLGSFFAYADYKEVICSRKPCTPSLDVTRELLGVFWLTHFGPAYKSFFGVKLEGVPRLEFDPDGGVTLQLAKTPGQVDVTARQDLIERLGSDSFANGGPVKERGKYVLTLEQLKNFVH